MIAVVCGPPGVGKTTIATVLQERLVARGHGVRLVDSDAFSRDTYDRLYRRVAGSGTDWLVAGTFYQRRWQERFATLGDVAFVHLRADLATCLARNRRRADQISEQGVHVVWREFDDPDADIVVDATDRTPGQVVDRVDSALEPFLARA